jgi:hypothetical protein
VKSSHFTKRNSKPEKKTRDFALKNSARFYCSEGNDNSQTKIHCMETIHCLSLVKDSLTVLNNKRLMESEMFYPLTFQLLKHEQLQEASMKILMAFSSCLLSITYFHMSNWNVYCELLCESLQTNVKEDIVELWVCFVRFMSYSL